MNFVWANSYLPRSLYGRAALILLVPVIALQLLVSVVFIQRHYSGVTEQMSHNVALDLRYLLQIAETADTREQALSDLALVADSLAFELTLPTTLPDEDVLSWIDFSGHAMAETLRAELVQIQRVDLSVNRQVWLWLETPHGVMSAMFDRRRVSATNPHQLLVLMVFAGAFLTIVAFVFLRNQLRPIRRLARTAEAFGKGQIRTFRPSGATEVRAAGQAFLDMRERIERQIEQRTMMLSGVSHDLRTPLTRMRLALSLEDETEEVQGMLNDVADMERLIDEFLAFSRDDSLDDPQFIDPAHLLREIVGKFESSGVPVSLVVPDTYDVVLLRPLAVSRALENLIGNGVKYGENCQVTMQSDTTMLHFIVEDDGPGIPENMRGEAQKPFVRLDAARNQNRGAGVGLGLAIAHDIARRHGGSLEFSDSATMGGLRADFALAR